MLVNPLSQYMRKGTHLGCLLLHLAGRTLCSLLSRSLRGLRLLHSLLSRQQAPGQLPILPFQLGSAGCGDAQRCKFSLQAGAAGIGQVVRARGDAIIDRYLGTNGWVASYFSSR